MIIAIGTDIVSIPRLRGVYERHPRRFLQRHFTRPELDYCLAKSDPLPSLAARFAAKEAFQKCWPQVFGWREVWVEMEGVKPRLCFAQAIQTRMQQEGWVAHLSLSHEREYATAFAVLEMAQVPRWGSG
jgi:holo-[acyl-carrier protein] synthase